jgi:50S ribosomal subunit-associated GTPase HflX
VNYWLEQLREFAPDDIKIMVVGNKIDRANERKLSKDLVKNYCKSKGVFYEETSAKENLGVEQMFRNMANSKVLGDCRHFEDERRRQVWRRQEEEVEGFDFEEIECCEER